MSKQLKMLMRNELQARFQDVDGGIFVSTTGLNSEKTYDFRKVLHKQGVKFTLLRNALARQAFVENGYPAKALDKVLEGSIGVCYTVAENSAAVTAKILAAWKKDARDKIVQWKGAFLDGQILGAKDAEELRRAPSKSEARAMLLGALLAPATRLLSTIREPHARLIYLLDARREKQEKGQPA